MNLPDLEDARCISGVSKNDSFDLAQIDGQSPRHQATSVREELIAYLEVPYIGGSSGIQLIVDIRSREK